MSLKVRNIITKGVYDVVHTNWLERCINQQNLLKWYIISFPSFRLMACICWHVTDYVIRC